MTFTVPIAESDVTSLVAHLAAKAPLASPTLTSSPVFPTGATATTQSAGDSSTKLATTAFATTADNLKANLASPTFTGTVTVPNAAGATGLAAFGQVPVAGTVGGPAKVVFRTGDSGTVSNNTRADDDTLKWTVGANDRWLVNGFLTFTAADGSGTATTADLSTGWSVPASGTMQWGSTSVNGNLLSGYGSTSTAQSPTALRTAAQANGQGGAALSWGVTVSGYYTGGGTGGTVAFQWAQNTSNAATLLLAKNSILLLWRLA